MWRGGDVFAVREQEVQMEKGIESFEGNELRTCGHSDYSIANSEVSEQTQILYISFRYRMVQSRIGGMNNKIGPSCSLNNLELSMKSLTTGVGLLATLVATCIAAGSDSESTTTDQSKPNIVLVMADDQGWGDMAYNGHPVVKTPNFDEAARSGLKFNRFYAAAPVCSPTRASVMTGRHPNRMGVFKWGYPIRPQERTIAEVLKEAGYSTAHFGKWHLGSVRKTSPAHPGKNGFDEWLSAPNFYDNDPILSHKGVAIQTKGESSIVTANAAIEWIRTQQKAEDPFFAVVWFGSPHGPHRAAREDLALYSDQPKNKQNFLGEVTGMDRAFGKIRKALADMKIRDNTILWYCSDNGALPRVGSAGKFRGNKGKVYEGGLLVPAIVEWPAKIPKPFETSLPANTSDIFPTLLDLAGVESKGNRPLDGVSLGPVFEGKTVTRKGMGFWDFNAKGISTPSAKWMGELLQAQKTGKDLPPHQSSQDAAKLPEKKYSTTSFPGHSAWNYGGFKLHRIEAKNGKITWELYNLTNDPYEKQNLADSKPGTVEQMKKPLNTWLISVVNSLNGADYKD